MCALDVQVFFSMLEIYNEQVTLNFTASTLPRHFLCVRLLLVSSSLTRWSICCVGAPVLQGASECERSSREASMWRVSARFPVTAQLR